ncbi:MAG: ankyrin repeat domain-containing protein, partial [Lachnospiraceae bacterium]|nr:ankyrin repeat domain-containing protein [Lachnospiraceae bacterium]
MSPLLEAIEAGDLPRLKSLLTESPSSIDETAGPLHAPLALIAAEKSSFPVLRYIVEYSRASLDIYDDDHRNILHYAALSGDPQKCRYLTERCGMDPLSGDRNLMTP